MCSLRHDARDFFNGAAFISAILYGCEGWLNVCVRDMEKIYNGAIKALLGVRITTANDLCLLEIGYPELRNYIRHRQATFLRNMINTRREMRDDPLMFAIELTQRLNTRMGQYINTIIERDDFITSGISDLRSKVTLCDKTKFITYCSMNPELAVHDMYTRRHNYVPEYLRIAMTRFRLSSHRLKIETGRWSRIPREQRLCQCGEVQDERHVLQWCPLVADIRSRTNTSVEFPDFLINVRSENDFSVVYYILQRLEC